MTFKQLTIVAQVPQLTRRMARNFCNTMQYV